jgi:hypothetical protein
MWSENEQRADIQDVDRGGHGEHGEKDGLFRRPEFVKGTLMSGIVDGHLVVWRRNHRRGLGDRRRCEVVVMGHSP